MLVVTEEKDQMCGIKDGKSSKKKEGERNNKENIKNVKV